MEPGCRVLHPCLPGFENGAAESGLTESGLTESGSTEVERMELARGSAGFGSKELERGSGLGLERRICR